MNGPGSSTDWSGEAAPTHGNVFVMIHRLLRGRYLITAALAAVFAVAGGAAGFFAKKPQFRSDAVIQIQPVLPKILFETEQSSVPQMFSNIVAAQADLISRPSVVEYAMESDRWRAVSAISGINSVQDFVSHLRVQNSRATQQLISVSFEHENAAVAHAANQAIVDAYMELHGRRSEQDTEATLGVLEARLRNRQDEKRRIDSSIAQIARDWGTDELSYQVQTAFETVTELQGLKRDLESRLEQLEALANRRNNAEAPLGVSEDEAAQLDPAIDELIQMRRTLQTRKTEMLAGGWLPGHREVRSLDSGIEQINGQIRERILRLEESLASGNTQAGAGGLSRTEIQTQLSRIEERLRAEQQLQIRLGEANLTLRDLKVQREDVERDIQRTEQRIDAIRTESQAANIAEVRGRVSVVSNPTRPTTPSSDKRIKLAAAGFVAGGALPVGLMLGLGLLGSRVRFSDDDILESARSRIIGVLPDLGKSLSDRELAEASAFAVHQIRAQLQILYGRDRHSVFSVTSPAPGDGKTSMIIALGLSFAESGDRTLLVDLDLIGRGLSLHFGHPNAPSLAEAAASGEDLRTLVHSSRFERLSVLPAGMGDDLRISRLSPEVIRNLVETFRGEFDTVLIDSGPILGSIEAGLLAPSVDGVLMVVGRNQLRQLVRRAVDQITAVGGTVVATVFNRASVQELRQSSSSMSVHFSRQASRQAADQAARGGGPSVGPLAGSLFPAAPAPEPGGRSVP